MKRLAAATTLVLTLALRAGAQTPDAAAPADGLPVGPAPAVAAAPPSGQGSVFRSGASLVSLNVTVSDGKRLVPGLKPEDFAVYEDGVLQHVQFFEAREIPIDLILLIDTSASMGDKMDVVHDAAVGFLTTLRPRDRGAVVTFGDRVNISQVLTSDRALLERAVRSAQAGGSTALNNAIYVALKQFARSAQQEGEVRRQAIAVLSDGEDTSSVIGFDDVLGMARKSGINIYTICLQNQYAVARLESSRRYFSESDFAMKSLAQETGAQSYFPQSVQDLRGIYAGISDELANQYSIGYAPTNARPDGRFRRIVIKVAEHPEFRPRARLGYTASSLAPAAAEKRND
ncbi:MAG: VWA domain-containing protein [Acidobacteriota bacterium]